MDDNEQVETELNNENKVVEQPVKTKSVKKNYFYNLLYQIFILVVPLIVTPYISRVLTAEGVGQYSFSHSLITYFTVFASLGFVTYGQREIAAFQKDRHKQSVIFWDIIICRFFSVLIMLGLNLVLFFTKIYGEYSQLMFIFSINIAAVAFDASFFFQGNEEFGKIVFRNFVIKALNVVLVFILIKEQGDLWKYCLLQSATVLISNISLWPMLRKYLVKIKISELNPQKRLCGTLKLFIPAIATQIYVMVDKTLIGFLVNGTYEFEEYKIVDGIKIGITTVKKYSDLENGYYEQSEKIIKMAMTVITSLGVVYLPRNSYLLAKGEEDKVKENVYNSAHFVWMLGIPMVFGFICVSSNFVPWFFGSGYEKCKALIMIFSPLILIIGFSNLICFQILAPQKRDKCFIIGSLVGLVVNIGLNCILIPFFWSYGAVIASLAAELVITIIYLFFVRKFISIPLIIKFSIKYLIAGLIMFSGCYFLSMYLDSSILNTFIIVGIGMIIYVLMLFVLRDKYFNSKINGIFNKVKARFRK